MNGAIIKKNGVRSKKELNRAIQEVLESPVYTKPCINCGFIDKTEGAELPRQQFIIQNLADKASDAKDRDAVRAADILFTHGYDQKEVHWLDLVKLLIEKSNMPEYYRNTLIAGLSDQAEIEIEEKPVQVVEWREDLELTSDDFPVQLQKGEETLVIKGQEEWEIFRKARTW